MSDLVPVWVDGVKFPDSMDALEALDIITVEERRAFWSAIHSKTLYKTHVVRDHEPRIRKVKEIKRMKGHKPGEMLLSGHCLHRLGAYVGGQW